MKKIASILIVILMICTLCLPLTAFAEDAPKEITVTNDLTITGNCIISKAGEYETIVLKVLPGSRLTIGEGVTLRVTKTFSCYGETELLGTLYIQVGALPDYEPEMIKVGNTGTFIDKTILECEEAVVTATVISNGNLWIIIAGAVVIIGGIAAAVIVGKKRKKA